MCHTDLHWALNHKVMFKSTKYPCVPGHELAGVVKEVGGNVTKFKVGDHIGVGCWVDSCLKCAECRAGKEQSCKKLGTFTYQDPDKYGRANVATAPNQLTMGGYSNIFVVHHHFGIIIPKTYPLEAAGPIFCAGVTVYEPLKKHKVGKGVRVGVVGLGGLGMTAIQLARAVGSDDVYAVSRGSKKEQVAREVGATGFIDSTDANAMSAAAGMLDLVIDTIPSSHDLSPYKKLVKPSTGVVHLLGMHEKFLCVGGREAGHLWYRQYCFYAGSH